MATLGPLGVIDANAAFLRLIGYEAADLAAGLIDWPRVAPECAAARTAATELLSCGSARFCQEFLRRDGRRVPVEVSAVLLSRVPLTWMVVVRDVAAERADQAASDQVRQLAELTAAMGRTVTAAELARTLADHLRQLLGAHLVTIIEVDPGRPLMRSVSLGDVPARVAEQWAEFSTSVDSPAVRAWRTRQPVFYGDPGFLDREFPHLAEARLTSGSGACLSVPLMAGGDIAGILVVTWPAPRRLSAADEDFLATAGGYAAQALGRIRSLEAEAAARGRAQMYEADHAAAHRLQQALLPQVPDRLGGASFGLCYRPAERGHDVGGDWYDVFELPGGRIGCAVGDVAGHDLTAAAAMGRLQLLLRYLAVSGAGPAQVLRQLDLTCPEMSGTDFATVAYAEYDPARRTLTYACAGHLPPLLVVAGQASYLDDGRCGPLGVAGSACQATLTVPPGARLILYTDGLIERRDRSLDQGLDQLAAAARACSDDDKATCHQLLHLMAEGQPLTDDVAIVCLTLNGL